MYEVKSKIFLGLAKIQKSAICNFLRALVKKLPDLTVDEICDKFFYDEKYYLEVNTSRFEFLQEVIDDEAFISETRLFIRECRKFYDYKKTQEPIIQAQKEFDKEKRKFLQEVKMSKELPTKKQISYYKSLCKRYNIDKIDTENLSKLGFRNEIDRILNEHQAD